MNRRILPSFLALLVVLNSSMVFAKDLEDRGLEELARFKLDELEHYNENDYLMLPIRQVGEELGYEINWNQKLKQVDIFKGAVNTSIKPGFNAYFFGRKAPIKLKSPPILKDSLTFVPEEFFTKILSLELVKEDGEIIFLQKRPVYDKDLEMTGYIKSVDRDRNNYSILLGNLNSDLDLDEIIIHIVDETIIRKDEKSIRAKELKVGQKIEARTPSFMTRGIPPETTAKELLLEDFIEIENKSIDSLNYPLIKSAEDKILMEAINQDIENFINSLREEDSYKDLDLDYHISFINQDILSIIFNGNFKEGGKDYSFSKILNFDLNTAKKIDFKNYFKKDKDTRDRLDRILEEKVRENYNKEYKEENKNLYFTEDGLVVFYYDLDDSIMLPVEIHLDYSEIADLVDN